MRKNLRKTLYLFGFLGTLFVLFLTIILQFQDENNKYNYLNNEFAEQNILFENLQTQKEFMEFDIENNNCNVLKEQYSTSIKNLYKLNNKLENYLESNDFIKNKYSLLRKKSNNFQILYWLLSEKINKVCPNSFLPILYLYSDKNRCEKCVDQAIILNYLRKKNSDNILVFSLDKTAGDSINLLKDKYKYEDNKVGLIIGGKFLQYHSYENLSKIICKDFPLTKNICIE